MYERGTLASVSNVQALVEQCRQLGLRVESAGGQQAAQQHARDDSELRPASASAPLELAKVCVCVPLYQLNCAEFREATAERMQQELCMMYNAEPDSFGRARFQPRICR